MSDQLHEPSAEIVSHALIDAEGYASRYAASIADPEGFWREEGKRLDWIRPYTRVKETSFAWPDVSIKWFEDGELNVAANCIDRHLATRGEQTAIIWESDDPGVARHISYRELHAEVSRFANVLKALGVGQGRPRRPLPADDPRGRLRDARLRPDRRGPLGGLRRLLRRGAALAPRGLGREAPRHRRRGAARRPPHAA